MAHICVCGCLLLEGKPRVVHMLAIAPAVSCIPSLHCSGALIGVAVSVCTFSPLSDLPETRGIKSCPSSQLSQPSRSSPAFSLRLTSASTKLSSLMAHSFPPPVHTYAHTLLKLSVCSCSAFLWAFSHYSYSWTLPCLPSISYSLSSPFQELPSLFLPKSPPP